MPDKDKSAPAPAPDANGDTNPPRPAQAQMGGSFAPPLDAKRLDVYRKLAAAADPEIGEAMHGLIKMMEAFLARPKAKAGARARTSVSRPHPSGLGLMEGLPDDEIKRLWDVVPWQREIDQLVGVPGKVDGLFESIDPTSDADTRDAAFHLAWFARELTIDREPITADVVAPDIEAARTAMGLDAPKTKKDGRQPITTRPL